MVVDYIRQDNQPASVPARLRPSQSQHSEYPAWYSNYDDYDDNKGKRSRPVSANEGVKKSEHRELCEVFGQPIPEKYMPHRI